MTKTKSSLGEGYKFIPSTMYQPKSGSIGAYVRYHAVKSDKIVIKHSDANTLWVDTPDRELLIIGDALSGRSLRPLGCNFDEFVPFSPFYDEYADIGMEHLMVNYFKDWIETKWSPGIRTPEAKSAFPNGKPKVTVHSDSGGFSLMSGAVDFIDPLDLAAYYDKNVDMGVTLDIPCSFAPDELLMEAAKVQKKNSTIILDNTNDDFKLINVVHGNNLQTYERYHEVVADKRMKSICVANAYTGNLINATGDVLAFMANHLEYDHFHVLGVYNLAVTPIYIRAINSPMFKGKLMTADASTASKCAGYRDYTIQRSPLYPVDRVSIGLKNGASTSSSIPSSYDILPCQCPVCSTIKYTDVFKHSTGTSATMSHILATHNVYAITKYVNMMNDYARSCTHEEYKEIVKGQLSSNRLREQALRGLDMVEIMINEGVEASRKAFSAYFEETRMFKTQTEVPRFTESDRGSAGVDFKPEEDGDSEEAYQKKMIKNVERSVKLFKDYHSNSLDVDKLREAKKEKKKKKKEKKGSKNPGIYMSNGGTKSKKLRSKRSRSKSK